jgi:cell wall-associated NlpC family hydrolase
MRRTVKNMTRAASAGRRPLTAARGRWAAWCAVGLLALLTAGCASSGSVPRPFPTPAGTPAPAPAVVGAADGYAIAGTALALQGVPYRSGGADPSGFDCSGLVQYVLQQHQISWPRVVRDQYGVGRRVGDDDIQPGDLLFFMTEGREVTHVGIAIGGDQFVHAPNARGVVRVDSLGTPYWRDRFVGARRAE